MKYIQKTIVVSLIVVLSSFAGSFCSHSMTALAAGSDMVMMGASQDVVSVNGEEFICQPGGVASHTINTCAFDCISKAPQAVDAKKVAVDTLHSCITHVFEGQYSQYTEPFFGAVGSSGIHPPAPDILSSVFKKE